MTPDILFPAFTTIAAVALLLWVQEKRTGQRSQMFIPLAVMFAVLVIAAIVQP